MALSFTQILRRNNPSSPRYAHTGSMLIRIVMVAFMLFFIVAIPLVNKAQDVLVGLTSNGGPEGEGTAFSIKSNGSNYSVIKSFADWGRNPVGDLVKGNDGNYYGMTYIGGAYNHGTIFMMTPAGVITVLKQLDYTNDGGDPMGELVKDGDGNFWGLTSGGGAHTYGTIFKITPAGIFTVIRHLSYASDGANPRGHLVLAKDGNFYGLTYRGGAKGFGTVFKLTASGDLTLLRSLNDTTDGGSSQSSLTEGKDGNLYGITYTGGTNKVGTIFRITKDGTTFTVLHNFNSGVDGDHPQGDLIQASDGNFYGMCSGGGSGGVGTIFKMKTDGTYSVLHHLIWTTDGSVPYGSLIENSDGNLYGLTSGGGAGGAKGVFFKITTGGDFTPLHGFTAATEGIIPKGSLIKGADGDLYAMASDGGGNFYGTVFKITTGGACTTLASFNGATQGRAPLENLIKGTDSAYYGTTSSGGEFLYGTIFKICGGKTTVLHSFNRAVDGGTPKGSLLLASNGSFYGMTTEGGTNSVGTIFKITSSGNYSVLRNLNGSTDGGNPQGSLIQGLDGNLYGMATSGGSGNSGTIFRITTGGDFKVLHHFISASEGSAPEGSLIQDTDSTMYGMTTNNARIFKITPSGTFNVMRTMTSTTDGNVPTGSFIKGLDGNFYATASAGGTGGFGTIFRISAAGNFKVLKSLVATTDGKTPKGKLLMGSDGNFYGMTSAGGANNVGTIFKITPAESFSVLKHFDRVADGGTPFGGLIIAPVNNLVANAPTVTTSEDTKKVITLSGSGGSPLTYNILTNPKRGKLTGTGANRTYTPKANYSGTDQFTFSVSVGCISSAPVTVKITITPVNDTPVLAPIGNKTVVKNTLLTFTATATNVDAGQTLSYSLVGAPTGAAINASTGVFTWTPSAIGSFIFKVRVTDNGSPVLFDEEQITVTVTASLAAVAETSVNDLQQEQARQLIVYPSPVKDKLTAAYKTTTGDVMIRIVNVNGVVVKTVNNPAGKASAEINVTELKPGVYVLQLQDEKGVQAVKFVKE